MIKLQHLLTSIVLFLLLSSAIIVLPVSKVFTHENTKETLHNINLYDRIVTIIAGQWLTFNPILNPDDQLFEALVRDHAEEIISSDWVSTVGDQFIDEVFYSMTYDDGFSNFTIDITPVKRNYIRVLEQSDIKGDIPKLESQIPDDIPVSLLMGFDIRQINILILEFEQLLKLLVYLKYLLLGLVMFPVGVYFLIGTVKEMIDWSMMTLLAVSTPFLIFPFVFKFLFLSPIGIAMLTNNYASFRETILVLVGLSFIEQMMHTWTIVALGLFAVSSIYVVWFKIYKRNEVPNGS